MKFLRLRDVRCTRRGRREMPVRFLGRTGRIGGQRRAGRDRAVRDKRPVRACRAACSSGGCTASSGTRGMPIRPENHATKVIPQRDAA